MMRVLKPLFTYAFLYVSGRKLTLDYAEMKQVNTLWRLVKAHIIKETISGI